MTTGVGNRLAAIERRIADACLRANRDSSSVTLLGAAKRQSEERLKAACRSGLIHFGENIVQEAEAHRRLLADFDLSWHLIGPLQSNKVRRAVELFDTVHSVDRLKIARKLELEAERAGKKIDGFLEVNLGDEPTKHGFRIGELTDAIAELESLRHLEIRGLMAIPPIADSETEARGFFRQLRELRDRLFPKGGCLSMGMSGDFELAIEEGATHIRVGSALFGPRSPRGGPA